MTRRVLRALVLATLLIALFGPWEEDYFDPGSFNNFFATFAGSIDQLDIDGLAFLAAIVLVPALCLALIARPASRVVYLTYRVLGALLGPWMLLLGLLQFAQSGFAQLAEAWGPALYLGAVILALLVELVPERAQEGPDYERVFR